MKKLIATAIVTVLVILTAGLVTPLCRAADSYHLVKEIPAAGEGNTLSIDPAGHRLYLAGKTTISMMDLNRDTVAGGLTNAPGIDGFVMVPRFHRGFFTVKQENQMYVLNPDTLQVQGKVPTGKKPGAILYEPVRELLYIFNEEDQSVSVYEADDTDFLTVIKLPGLPGAATADSKTGRVFCSTGNEITVIDTKTLKIVDHWPISPGQSVFSLTANPTRHRLFLTTADALVMMDSDSGKVLATISTGKDGSASAFDPAAQLVFSSCPDGTVAVVHEDTPDRLTVVQTLKTEPGAQAMALDPKTHRLYLASSLSGQPSRNTPDSTKIMVFGTSVLVNH